MDCLCSQFGLFAPFPSIIPSPIPYSLSRLPHAPHPINRSCLLHPFLPQKRVYRRIHLFSPNFAFQRQKMKKHFPNLQMSVKPALNVLVPSQTQDAEMAEQSPTERSPKGSAKNTLGLTLPGATFPHSIDSMLTTTLTEPNSPPRRIILNAEKDNNKMTANNNNMLKVRIGDLKRKVTKTWLVDKIFHFEGYSPPISQNFLFLFHFHPLKTMVALRVFKRWSCANTLFDGVGRGREMREGRCEGLQFIPRVSTNKPKEI